ncbi:BACON domain-containing protein [Algoriphagus sp. Y33]|uniref:BACON domain-containing protein n=1 Tax=Algoriphagus sp. Y33 TaxID=2772483 RepID=UPI001785E25A|nr:BACON domain-containing protein [Algoriphagus sp. Y33]
MPYSSQEDSQLLSITGNQNWTIEIEESWITANPVSGSGNAQITLTVKANSLDETRAALIRVRFGAIAQIITVNQSCSLN